MQKKFIINLIILLFLNFLIKPFWILGIDRNIQNIVGPENYGFYYAIINFSFLFNIFLDLGITNFNNRNIAQNNHLLNKYFSGIVVIKILLSLLYVLITISFGLLIGYRGWQLNLLFVLAFNQILISFILYLRSNLSGLHFFKTDSVISILDRFLMILFCSFFIWGNYFETKINIEIFVYIQTISYLITGMVAFVLVLKKSNFTKLYWDKKFFIVIIKQSFPFALLVLIMTFYNKIDSVMLERLLPAEKGAYQSGIYASAFRLLDAINMLPYLFSVLLLPIFAKMLKMNENISKMIKLAFSLLITPAIIIALISILYSSDIMNLLYPKNISETETEFISRLEQISTIFSILISCFIAISTTYIFGTLLTANGSLKKLNTFALIGLLINIILNFLVIPKFYAIGAAYVSLITQFLTAILQTIYAIKLFNIKVKITIFVKYFILIGFVFLLNISLQAIYFKWIYSMIFVFVASIIFSTLLKLINIADIKLILHNNKNY